MAKDSGGAADKRSGHSRIGRPCACSLMPSKRRSGRIAKELAIVLLGTDTTGKVFSEETKTVVLSRHGAGVLSRYRFTPDEVLTLRLPDSTKEAVVRLVGQIGGEPGRYVYGLAFVDPDPHFWPMEFPPPEPFESANHSVSFECSFCEARQDVKQGDIEDDVYSVLGNILLFCPDCGISTPWKKAQGEPPPASAAKAAQLNFNAPPPSPGPSKSALHAHAPSFAGSMEPTLSASLHACLRCAGVTVFRCFNHLRICFLIRYSKFDAWPPLCCRYPSLLLLPDNLRFPQPSPGTLPRASWMQMGGASTSGATFASV